MDKFTVKVEPEDQLQGDLRITVWINGKPFYEEGQCLEVETFFDALMLVHSEVKMCGTCGVLECCGGTYKTDKLEYVWHWAGVRDDYLISWADVYQAAKIIIPRVREIIKSRAINPAEIERKSIENAQKSTREADEFIDLSYDFNRVIPRYLRQLQELKSIAITGYKNPTDAITALQNVEHLPYHMQVVTDKSLLYHGSKAHESTSCKINITKRKDPERDWIFIISVSIVGVEENALRFDSAEYESQPRILSLLKKYLKSRTACGDKFFELIDGQKVNLDISALT